ncbi:MAG: hypothetical protein KHZ62_02390 [Clostridiales bacterium]|nr:hypothetical protein [Clostridiales bacterium]
MKNQDLEVLKKRLEEIRDMGWIQNQRPGNFGGVGNTLEDLLHIAENNRPMPDFGTWELKSQRLDTSSLLTLFHAEPLPRKAKFISAIFLPKYGWAHQKAGIDYPLTERSFRQTISTKTHSDRGFQVKIDETEQIVYVDFCFEKIEKRHQKWQEDVRDAAAQTLDPKPYWTYGQD